MAPDAAARPALDELWLRSLQRLTSHVAHDLKGALNGASVNLEVIRSRAENPDRPITDVQKFSGAAAESVTAVIRMTGALLSLGRAAREPVDVSLVARQMTALLEDTLRSDGGRMEIQVEGGLAAMTGAPASAVRLALGEALLAAVASKSDVSVRVRPLPAPQVRVTGGKAGWPDGVEDALRGIGIVIETDGHGISIAFPGPTDTSTEGA